MGYENVGKGCEENGMTDAQRNIIRSSGTSIQGISVEGGGFENIRIARLDALEENLPK